MITEEERHALFNALADAKVAILVKEPEMSFEQAAQKYRALEVDFVARAPDDEEFVLETRRRIAENILSAAYTHDEPFDVCNKAWNDLLRLGFTNRFFKTNSTWCYVKCCLYTDHPEEGIAVLEPLMAEIEEKIAMSNEEGAVYHGEELKRLHKLRAELIAQRDAASQDK
jgi:hypothetical protein